MTNKDMMLYGGIAVLGYLLFKESYRVATGWTWNGQQWVPPKNYSSNYTNSSGGNYQNSAGQYLV